MASPGSRASAAVRMACTSAGLGADLISAGRTGGGSARRATLRSTRSHRSAACRAAPMRACTRRTVVGERPLAVSFA